MDFQRWPKARTESFKEGEPDEQVNLLFKVFHQSMIQNINDRKLRKLLLAYFTIVFFDRDDQQQDPSP